MLLQNQSWKKDHQTRPLWDSGDLMTGSPLFEVQFLLQQIMSAGLEELKF